MRRWMGVCALGSILLGCPGPEPIADAGASDGGAPAGAALALSRSSIEFGELAPGRRSAAATLTVTNDGDDVSGELAWRLAGAHAEAFELTRSTCAGRLAPGASCELSVVFTPVGTQSAMATLVVEASPGGGGEVVLAGLGTSGPHLLVSPTPVDFEALVGAASEPVLFTVTHTDDRSLGPISVSLEGAAAGDFTLDPGTCAGATLEPDARCTVSVRFAPTERGERAATLVVVAARFGEARATLTGHGLAPARLELTPTLQDFGAASIGLTSAPVTFTVENGGDAPSGAPDVALHGPRALDFQIVRSTCSAPLAPAARCELDVSFAPSSIGDALAMLVASADPGDEASATLTGLGAVVDDHPVISPSTHDFGTIAIGAMSAPEVFTVRNYGLAPTPEPLTVTLQGANPGDFVLDGGTCVTGPISGGGSCTFTVAFAPTVEGARSASVRVTAPFAGVGTAALAGQGG